MIWTNNAMWQVSICLSYTHYPHDMLFKGTIIIESWILIKRRKNKLQKQCILFKGTINKSPIP